MSTEKGQKMTLKMSTGRNKIPLYFILRVEAEEKTQKRICLIAFFQHYYIIISMNSPFAIPKDTVN